MHINKLGPLFGMWVCGYVSCGGGRRICQIFVFESQPPAFEDAAVAKALLALGWRCFVLILWLITCEKC